MQIEIINKEIAAKKAAELKDKAFAIAESFGTLPGYCQESECLKYVQLLSLTQLKEGESCIFIDGEPADQLTDFRLGSGQQVIGKLCVRDISEAYYQNERLCLKYIDGIIEYFKYQEEMNCWAFDKNNLGTTVKPYFGILN